MQSSSVSVMEPPPARAVMPPSGEIGSVLERLRDYLHGFHPERARHRPLPLAFWDIDEEALFMEALSALPLFMGEIDEHGHAALPEAFRLAFPIFWIEENLRFNGWTALRHAGEALLPRAIAAYHRLGLEGEAAAFDAALQAFRSHPHDDGAIEAAYKSVPGPLLDDQARYEALRRFFRGHPGLWVHRRADH